MNRYSGKPFLVSRHLDLGYEVWAAYDKDADVFTCCASEEMDDCIGEAASPAECRQVASNWFNDLQCH